MNTQRKAAQRGASYLEVLVATLLLSLVAMAAVRTWQISGKVTTAKRVTEMTAFVGTSEIERLKAQTYNALVDSLPDGSGNLTPSVSWYNQYGVYLPGATTGAYKATVTVKVMVDRNARADTEDLRQIQVAVRAVNGTQDWTCRTMITFGGF